MSTAALPPSGSHGECALARGSGQNGCKPESVDGCMINPWRWRPRVMKQNRKCNSKGRSAKSVLRLPDLEVAKSAVLNSLSCPDAQRGYRHAIDDFVDWYCSEPRLSYSRTVVVRYRMHLSRDISPQARSIFGWVPFADWRTRRQIADFSAPIWQL